MDKGFMESVQTISEVMQGMWNFCMNVWEIICNPVGTVVYMIDVSYWILLIIAIICAILTLAGCKKTKNGATVSTIVYIILQCLKAVLV